jgi:hypothetical protein
LRADLLQLVAVPHVHVHELFIIRRFTGRNQPTGRTGRRRYVGRWVAALLDKIDTSYSADDPAALVSPCVLELHDPIEESMRGDGLVILEALLGDGACFRTLVAHADGSADVRRLLPHSEIPRTVVPIQVAPLRVPTFVWGLGFRV